MWPRFSLVGLSEARHSTYGIDFSPASIAWAKSSATEQSLSSEFVHGDVCSTEYGTEFDLAMLIFGEIDVFSAEDLSLIVRKARAALNTGGVMMLEPHEPGIVRANFETGRSWSSHQSGLFSERPHLLLEEGFWHDDVQMAMKRWYVVDAKTGEVTPYSQMVVQHTKDDLVQLIEAEGFTVSEAPGGWSAGNEDGPPEFYPLIAITK
ncbi:MAG: class I SAM-dependent methyltransferase [Chloroflexi bacterium]|nr:class I SAM-dependent methyltransferase [Chloroflexota bacterium]MBT7466970.1 class I SAM-dependent methyltransferase [Chloroflexota bacterium]